MKRRSFLKYLAAGGLTVVGSPLIYGSVIEPNQFEVVEQSIQLPRLGPGFDGLRVVQFSDLHMGWFFGQAKLERAVDLILAQKPDLVFFTGDYLVRGNDNKRALIQLSEPLGVLAKHVPVFSVMGNHDYYDGYDIQLLKLLKQLGIEDVTNSIHSYQQSGDTLYVAGVGTLSTGHMGLAQLIKQAPSDSAVVLLAHEPDVAQWHSPEFIMQFSGHSHGGQIKLPSGEPLFLPWMAELYPSGLYNLDGFYLYTNRGLGMTHMPIRVNCPPEITVFNLTAA